MQTFHCFTHETHLLKVIMNQVDEESDSDTMETCHVSSTSFPMYLQNSRRIEQRRESINGNILNNANYIFFY